MSLLALLGSVLLRADESPGFKPVVEVFFEARSKTPKVAGVVQLTPVPAGQFPGYFRRLSFAGERHLASGPLKSQNTTSWSTYQKRDAIGGAILYRYDAATDTIVVSNESVSQSGSVNAAPWGYEESSWPVPPVLTVEVPLSTGGPIGYNTTLVAANNPLGLAVRSAVQAGDDNVFVGSVGGYNAVAATELQFNFQMALEDEEDPTEEIERRARVGREAWRLGAAVCSTWRETRRPASQSWKIREVTVTYRLRTCPGDHFVKKLFRQRRIDVPNAAWERAWSAMEMVQVRADNDRDRLFELPLVDDYEVELVGIETMPAPGCGGCGAGGIAGGSAGPQNGSIHWLIPLGARADGSSAGALLLHRPHLTAEIYSPAALELALAEGKALKDAAGALRQILVPQALVDVVVLSAQAYELRFHERSRAGSADASGLYAPAGNPYLTWRIENPAGGAIGDAAARLRVTRLAAGEAVVTEIDESQPGRRIFSEGGGLRITETTASAWVGSRVETIVVRNAAGAVATKRQLHYQQFAWGDEKIREVLDPEGAALITEWTYGTTPGLPAYRQVIKVRRPDGSEEQTLHDNEGYTVRQLSPVWTNATQDVTRNFRRVDLDGDGIVDRLSMNYRAAFYNSLSLEWIVEWGALPGAGLRLRDHFQARTDAAQWNTPGNLRTRERYTAADGELVYRLTPDGVLTLRQRTTDAGGNTVVTEQRGAADVANEAVVDGSRTVTVTSPKGQVLATLVTDIATGRTLEAMSVVALDDLGRPIRLTHPDGAVESRDYCAACGEVVSIALRGVTTDFLFDALGRRTDEIRRAGGTVLAHTRQHYDAEGRVVQTVRVDRATGAETVLAATTYDLAGRVVGEYSPTQGTTTHAYAFGAEQQTVVTTTFADGGTRIETRGASGALASVRGTAAAPVDYQYVGGGQGYLLRTLRRNDNGTVATEEQAINLLGQTEAIRYSDGARVVRSFDAGGRLVREVDPDGVSRLLAYDAQGQLAVTAVDLNRNGLIDYAGTDRITRTRREVAVRDGVTVRREISERWETNNVDQPTTVAVAETSVDGLRSWRTVRGLTTAGVTAYDGAGGQTVTTIRPDGTVIEQRYLGERLMGESTRHSTLGALGATTNAYDAAGRLISQTDARGGVTTYTYDDRDRLVAVTAPDPDPSRSGPGYDAPTMSYGYDAMSRVTTTTLPEGGIVTTRYLPTGQVQRTAGARTFPIEYTYDQQGRLKTMTTWRDFSGDAGRAVTSWSYDDQRGWLTGKSYADGGGATYGYSAAGRLVRRTWARGVTTTYSYNDAGEVRQTSYSDATPAISLDYDRAGRVRGIADAAGQRALGYDATGALRSESYATGLLAGAGIERSYDAGQRLAGLTATFGGPVAGVAYSYDAASRLQALASGPDTVAYSYLADSGLIAGVGFTRGGAERLRTTRSYDRRDRLAAVTSTAAAGEAVGHAYAYDAADQRVRVTREGGSYWTHGYDALGQVTGGRKFLADGTPALGLDFAWTFDDIGNRRTAVANGQTSTYTANALNQYGRRSVPGVVDVLGAAAADTAVAVSGAGVPQLALRQGETYFRQLPVANDATAQVVPLRVVALRDPAGAAVAAGLGRPAWVPQSPELFSYDADGSLVGDGRWSYSWDAENRLIGMETLPAAAAQGWPRQKLEFVYDAQSRRVKKRATSQAVAGLINQVASFFPNETLSGAPVVTTRDGAIDGTWSGPPDAALPSDGWSLRVTARLRVPVGGSWTFSAPLRGDDALRLYLDEQLLLDAWSYGAPAPRATVTLEAERDYLLRFEFKDGGSVAQAQLRWSGPGVAEQVIPNAADAVFGVRVAETRFLYDGWNLLAEINAAGAPVRTYLWGLDVSGTRQGAGGVGGLLAVTDAAAGGTHFVASDGNGNVAALVRAADGVVSGRYDHHAFGETVELSGEAAAANPFRYSTKYTDAETGLLYYGFRYYDPALGRWLGRDPYEESGGANLYGFVQNGPTGAVDPFGLALYAFDGTSNDGYRDEDGRKETNVYALWKIYEGNRWYLAGVGTNDGLLNPLGAAFGLGGQARISEMLEKADEFVGKGDYVADILGFSRGAAQARAFANKLKEKHPCVKIRWMGLFDTVASEGLPNDVNLGYKLGLPDGVGAVLHLTAGGERRRSTFALTSINVGPGQLNSNPNLREVEVPEAVHSDVGGGYDSNRGLANFSLVAMWQDGIAHNVPFRTLPSKYSNYVGTPHDSRWINDKIVELFTGARKRKIYYHP